ncbi:hypothetical protein [Priestia megaterium]|uniref:hypothetical protein n=1 Tax=Priestia megaterium TaxID=1404 RepID=UPI003000BFF9
MLYGRLENLYKKNQILEQRYPLNEYYPLLRSFIAKEVDLGAEYLSPYRFALSYSLPVGEAIRFFIGLADASNILTQYYKYQCDECDTINIIKDEDSLLNFECKECGFQDALTRKEYLSEVKILFRLDDDILEETEKSLKDNPLSREGRNASEVLGRGIDVEIPIEKMEEVIYDDKHIPISTTAEERLKKIQRYRAIVEGAI